jgi:hypothetical protein
MHPSPSPKRAKLGISTSMALLDSSSRISRTTGGIALHSSSSPHRLSRSSAHAHMSSTGSLAFPHVGGMVSLNRSLPPSAFQSSINNLGEYFNTPSNSNMQPNEAKSLYFAHYNGLEVWRVHYISQRGM